MAFGLTKGSIDFDFPNNNLSSLEFWLADLVPRCAVLCRGLAPARILIVMESTQLHSEKIKEKLMQCIQENSFTVLLYLASMTLKENTVILGAK
jgi:hypothetical protein